MHILIVGSQRPHALEHQFVHYLRDLGARVSVFPSQDILFNHQRNFFLRIGNRLGWINREIYRQIGMQLKAAVQAARPDVIWVFKGMEILPGCLVELRAQGYVLANFNPDHPFVYTTRATGNANISESVPLYDLHLSYSNGVIQAIRDRYAISTARLPFGHALDDPELKEPLLNGEVSRACFVGNPDPQRAAFIRRLSRLGVEIDVYGDHWDRYLWWTRAIQVFPARYGASYWPTLRRYRVQLNILRRHNEGSHNMRTFEIPAAGVIQIADATPEHREFFEEGREIFLFDSVEECAEKTKKVLAMSPTEAAIIRQAARQRSLDGHYHYRHRAATVLEAFEKLVEVKRPA